MYDYNNATWLYLVDFEVGAVMEILRKVCVLNKKCSKRSYVRARISTQPQTKI